MESLNGTVVSLPKRRSSDGPLWVRVLERQGLPTLIALGLGWALWSTLQADRADHREDRAALVAELKEINTHLGALEHKR